MLKDSRIMTSLGCEDPNLTQNYDDAACSRKKQVGHFTFTTSALGLLDFVEVVYSRLCLISLYFSKSVSLSMFTYYVTQIYYMRICYLEFAEGNTEADVLYMVEESKSMWIIPQLLSDYIHSIGPFKDSTGIYVQHREVSLPSGEEVEGINGFFGRVDRNTHTHYENRISPGVLAKRIIEELFLTEHSKENSMIWDLPAALVPTDVYAGKPSMNLLGWKIAIKLTPEQVDGLHRSGIYVDNQHVIKFPHSTRFCFNLNLMTHVNNRLKKLKKKVKHVIMLDNRLCGSIAQQDFQQADKISEANPTSFSRYGTDGTYSCGFSRLAIQHELFAHVAKFRIKRSSHSTAEGIINPWCCYNFNNYLNVPDSWSETRNVYFNFGNCEAWNEIRLRSEFLDTNNQLYKMMENRL